MRKIIFIGIAILVLFLVSCRKQKAKEITGAKCVRCGCISHAETTLVVAPPWFEDSIYTVKGWVKKEYITNYRDTICDSCAEIIKKEADLAFKVGVERYKNSDYGGALKPLREAIKKGRKDAVEWEAKAFRKWCALVDRKYARIRHKEKQLSKVKEKEKFAKKFKRQTEKTVDNVHFMIYPPETPIYDYSGDSLEIPCEVTNNAKIQIKKFVIQAEVFSRGKRYTGSYKATSVHPLRTELGTILLMFYGSRIDSIRIGKCSVKF